MTRSEGLRPPRRRCRGAIVGGLIAGALAVVATACSSSDDTADGTTTTAEVAADAAAVCESLQGMVDELDAGRSMAAVQALDALQAASTSTSDATLADNGATFFRTINDTVPDPGSLTAQESSEVGDKALATAQPALQAMIDRCGELGLPIENLPTEK